MPVGSRALAAVAICASAACSYPSYEFVPDDSGPTIDLDSTIGEASVDVRSDSVLDSFADGHSDTTPPTDTVSSDTTPPPPDTEPPPDTTPHPDTTPPPDTTMPMDAPPTGCSASHSFCDDWNTSTTAQARWMASFVRNGSLGLDTSSPYSPPKDFISSINTTTAAEASAALNETLFAPALDSFALVDVQIFLVSGSYAPGTVLVKMQRPGTGRGFDLSLGPSDLYVEVLGKTNDTAHLAVPVPVGRWFHVRMKGQLLTSGARVTLWIDDMTTPVYDKTGLSSATVDSTFQQLNLGLYTNASGITAFQARFDDCSLDFL